MVSLYIEIPIDFLNQNNFQPLSKTTNINLIFFHKMFKKSTIFFVIKSGSNNRKEKYIDHPVRDLNP